jgi:signal transduction histidine kinase
MYRARGGEVVSVNLALARMHGFDTAAELMASELRAQLLQPKGWKRRDGADLDVQLWWDEEDGERIAWVVDSTASAALQSTATTLQYVMKLVPGIYWRVDSDSRVAEVGGAMEEVLGYSGRGRYVGRTITEHQQTEPTSLDTAEHHRRALAGEMLTFDNEYKGKQLSSTLGPLRDGDGKIIGAIGTAIDVTRVRQLERRMIDAQRAESLGVLAGGLAHDFNNLLVAVIGSAEIALRDLPAGSAARATVENIRTAGLRAAELTDQLLAYAGRGGRGTTRVYPGPLVEELLRILAPSLEARVRTSVEMPNNLALRGDPGQVRQVLLNLITNARDAFGPSGGSISIRARLVSHDGEADDDAVLLASAGDYVSIIVADDGPGFDRETRRHVFEPFFTTKSSGNGLGLAAVLGIVRAHGGGIRVVSEPGRGALFEILWPAAIARAQSPSPGPVTARKSVLVIDDEDLVRDVVARMVEELGYSAVTASDGFAALALVDQRPFDVVLVDLTMPVMSGAEVIAGVRARRPDIPIVLCSGFDRSGSGPVAADAYLPKPFRIEALERTLAKLLPLRSV